MHMRAGESLFRLQEIFYSSPNNFCKKNVFFFDYTMRHDWQFKGNHTHTQGNCKFSETFNLTF